MALMSADVRKHVTERLSVMTQPVELVVHSDDSEEGRVLLELAQELAEVNSLVQVRAESGAGVGASAAVEQAPALTFRDPAGRDPGLRYYGLPLGYEFVVLLEDLIDLGTGQSQLSARTLEQVRTITRPTVIKVFVTPTCPYCPQAARRAHQLALVNPHIRAEVIDASVFPELARKYNVYGVPRTVVNETQHFEGAVPEHVLLDHVLKAPPLAAA